MTVSYVFEQSDGVVLKGHRSVSSRPEIQAIFPEVLAGIDEGSGKLLIRFDPDEKTTMEIEGHVVAGKTEGLCKMFIVADGERLLSAEVSFVGGRKDGPVIAYLPDGGVMYEGFWNADQKNGDWIFNYPDGGCAVSARLREDHFDGPVQIFDAAGTEIAHGIYKAGQPTDGTFIEDPWALIFSISQYGDSFTTRRFRGVSGMKSEEEAIEILKKVINEKPIRSPLPTAVNRRG
ncbi:MAG: hypothetical protein SynsKO_07190 [Synoicihabitans sp.]